MKPQALQDAIKGLALKKKEKGEWKDPYVKKYTITKEDYLREKQRFNPTAVRSLEEPLADSSMLSEMQSLLQQMQAEKYDWKKERDALLNEMSQVKSQIKGTSSAGPSPTTGDGNSAELSALRAEVKDLKLELEQLQTSSAKGLESLRQELNVIKNNNSLGAPSSSSVSNNSEVESLRQELQSLRSVTNDLDKLKDEIAKLKTTKTYTTATSSSNSIDDLRDEVSLLKTNMVNSNEIDSLRKEIAELKVTGRSRPSTPSRATLPSCKPHSVQELSDRQRKDKVLKEYLVSKTGLPFLYKSMSIPDYTNEEGEIKHLVCFENRLYIPKKLRDLTMEYYVQHHPYDSYTAMERHCIWPDCEEEMKEYKKNRS